MMEEVFGNIYRRRIWGEGESVSGPGSGLVRTEPIRTDLAALMRSLAVRSLLDAGCGDFHWMQAADLALDAYIGIDVVWDLVETCAARYQRPGVRFAQMDITCDPLPCVDLILCRDVLPHFSFADIHRAIDNFVRSGSRWLLTNTFVDRQENADIATGEWRPLNLERPPFLLPTPSRVLDEYCHHSGGIYADKRLALWAFDALR
jgi:SAM-dependent methyltransferase